MAELFFFFCKKNNNNGRALDYLQIAADKWHLAATQDMMTTRYRYASSLENKIQEEKLSACQGLISSLLFSFFFFDEPFYIYIYIKSIWDRFFFCFFP
jgi:hypothetical protein